MAKTTENGDRYYQKAKECENNYLNFLGNNPNPERINEVDQLWVKQYSGSIYKLSLRMDPENLKLYYRKYKKNRNLDHNSDSLEFKEQIIYYFYNE